MKVLLLLAACVAVAVAGDIKPGTPVSQCKAQNLECPEFALKDVKEGYEVRTYPAGWWVGTTYIGMNNDNSNMFMKLFNYISGQNDKKQKIAMTAPVITEIIPGPGPNCESNFTMSFYVPKSLWNNIPQPSSSDVFLHQLPEVTVYVKAFSGYAKQQDYINAATKLAESINDETKFEHSFWLTAGYDSPFRFWGRRNEVLFVKKN